MSTQLALFLGLLAAAVIVGAAYIIGPRRVVCPRCAAFRPPLTLVGDVEVRRAVFDAHGGQS